MKENYSWNRPVSTWVTWRVLKCHVHRHTQTWNKNNVYRLCRVNFPRKECTETRMIANTTADFILKKKNSRRIGRFRPRGDAYQMVWAVQAPRMTNLQTETQKKIQWINFYNTALFNLRQGNMVIQPCGSDETISY